MMHRPEITPEILNELLHYDGVDGTLYWNDRADKWFASTSSMKIWRKRFLGKPALHTIGISGYRSGSVLCKGLYAHRVILAMTTGQWPDRVDHVNGCRSDNRLTNLRSVSNQDNCKNTEMKSSNTSGRVGVYRHRKNGTWIANICVDGSSKYIGSYETIEDASAARRGAEIQHGFHENHGREPVMEKIS